MSGTRSEKEFVRSWLNELGLSSYFDTLVRDGYDDIRILRDLCRSDEDELSHILGMPRGHARQFSKGLQRLRATSDVEAGQEISSAAVSKAKAMVDKSATGSYLRSASHVAVDSKDWCGCVVTREGCVVTSDEADAGAGRHRSDPLLPLSGLADLFPSCEFLNDLPPSEDSSEVPRDIAVTPSWSSASTPRLAAKVPHVGFIGIEDESTSDGSVQYELAAGRNFDGKLAAYDSTCCMQLVGDVEGQQWAPIRAESMHQYPPPVQKTFVHFDASSESDFDMLSHHSRARSCPPVLHYAIDVQPGHRKKMRRKRIKMQTDACMVECQQEEQAASAEEHNRDQDNATLRRVKSKNKVKSKKDSVDDERDNVLLDQCQQEASTSSCHPSSRLLSYMECALLFGFYKALLKRKRKLIRGSKRVLRMALCTIKTVFADSVCHVRDPRLRSLAGFPWVSVGVVLLVLGIVCGGGDASVEAF